LPIVLGLPEVVGSAHISRCGQYRYSLKRCWDPSLPQALIIGLNPSTADATLDDPTVRRCVGFVRDWGFGGLALVNLFAFRAIDPSSLVGPPDPVGPENDDWIARLADESDLVVAAWGVHGGLKARDSAVIRMLGPLHCLGRTKDGFPRHPLYLSRHTQLEAFR